MPKIRKKTSKRGTTHQRSRIKHKVSESRKKAKKQAKKDPQWKSKHKKDPGIPNSYPFKDQILAEVAEQRRQAGEEKQRKKNEKKNCLELPSSSLNNLDRSSSPASMKVIAVQDSAQNDEGNKQNKLLVQKTDDVGLKDSEHMDMKSVLDIADIVLQVLDARDPQSCRSSYVEEYLYQRKDQSKLFLVLNKIDMCSRENVQSWTVYLRDFAKTFMFRSASAFMMSPKTTGFINSKQTVDDALGLESLLNALRLEAIKKPSKSINVAIIGVGNVGKSSLINSFSKNCVCPMYTNSSSYQGPSTTHCAQDVELNYDGYKIHFIDTPSLIWQLPASLPCDDEKKIKAHDLLLLNKGRIDRIKDPNSLLAHIVSKANHEELMVFYNLPAYLRGDVNAFLSSLARSKAVLKKDGALDLNGAARIVLRDWGSDKFPRHTQPPLSKSSVPIDATDQDILKELKSQQEVRKSTGIVTLQTEKVEWRQPILDLDWQHHAGNQRKTKHRDDAVVPLVVEEDVHILEETSNEVRSKRARQSDAVLEGSLSARKVAFSILSIDHSLRASQRRSNVKASSAKKAKKNTYVASTGGHEAYDFDKHFS